VAEFERTLKGIVETAARAWPSVVITGPRRAGKTHLLRHCFPRADYRLLEDPDVLERVRADPRAFLDELRPPVILDEIQNVPELLPYVRTLIDAAPTKRGRWLITGSQDFALMHGVSESMSGRAAVFRLLPLALPELGRWNLLRGGYPEVWLRPGQASVWFSSYVQTYLERDVRAVTNVRDLGVFRRFMSLLALRSGQMLNRTELAGPLGVTVPTISQWLGVLETTGIIALVRPWHDNLGKRIVKTPKLYWLDCGLLTHLLGFDDLRALERSSLIGPVFETFVASELIKRAAARGRPAEVFWFRDQQGLEVDFVVPAGNGEVELVEAKWTRTPTPAMARPMSELAPRFVDTKVRCTLVHPARRGAVTGDVPLAPGVRAMSVEHYFTDETTSMRRSK
jgi:predicted AAA+ superfamily ATPase